MYQNPSKILPFSFCSLTMRPALADPMTDDVFPSSWLLDTNLEYLKEIPHQQQTIVHQSQFLVESYRDVAAELDYIADQRRLVLPEINGGCQLRMVDSSNEIFLSNFAISGQYDFGLANRNISVGSGFHQSLGSTIFP